MKTRVSPKLVSLKRRYRLALALLRKASTDFSPDGNQRFLELKKKAEALRLDVYFEEQVSCG